jgi:hypothetical protein
MCPAVRGALTRRDHVPAEAVAADAYLYWHTVAVVEIKSLYGDVPCP